MDNRVIALIDMDCFYCQVEVRLNPSLKNKPLAVVQYNTWRGGGIIAVNYEARDRGVTRHMRGDEAKNHCPEIELVHVPSVRGKADLTNYREAGREVAAVLCENCKCVERASIDEAYLDLTEEVNERFIREENVSQSQLANTFIVGYSQQGNNDECVRSEGLSRWLNELYSRELDDVASKKLAIGALIIEEIRASVYEKTGFRCSAGIAHNKIMAKLVCGLHKPNRQTVLPTSGIAELFSTLPVQKVRNLGGKFGTTVIETLGCKVMADLAKFSERELQTHFDEKTGTWLHNIARGIDLEPVTSKLMSKSIGCCKKFPGRSALRTRQDVMHWLNELSNEISDRLDEDYNLHKRRPHLLTASVQQLIDKKKVSMSKSNHISSYDTESIMNAALVAIKKTNNAPSHSDLWQPPLLFLGISVGKFAEESSSSNKTISHFFKTSSVAKSVPSENSTSESIENRNQESSFQPDKSTENRGENKTSCKVESKTSSFFERYLKNKKTKTSDEVINDAEISTNKLLSTEKEESSDCDMFDESDRDDHQGLEEKFNDKFRDNDNVGNERTVICNGSVNSSIKDSKSYNNFNVESSHENNEENINWTSPREIFPDINNLDDSLVQLMPTPIREKITAYRMEVNKNNDDIFESPKKIVTEHSNTESNNESNVSMFSNNCDVVPSTSKIDNCTPTKYNPKQLTQILENGSKDDNQSTSDRENTMSPDVFVDSEYVTTSHNNESQTANKSANESDVSNCFENEISEVCPHCRETVRLSEFPEHLDHHIALDLHKTLNSSEVSQVPKKRNLNSTENKPLKKKRGRPSSKNQVVEKDRQTKNILSFFSRN